MERTTHPDRHPALRLPRPMDSRSAQGTCSLVSRSKYFFGTLIYMRMDTGQHPRRLSGTPLCNVRVASPKMSTLKGPLCICSFGHCALRASSIVFLSPLTLPTYLDPSFWIQSLEDSARSSGPRRGFGNSENVPNELFQIGSKQIKTGLVNCSKKIKSKTHFEAITTHPFRISAARS